MKTTAATMVVETSSEPAIVLEVRVTRPTAATRVAAANAKMNADPDRLMRLAAANTRRLTGKPKL